MKRIFMLLPLLCLWAQANAQLASWQFGSPASNGDETTFGATYVNPHVTASVLSRGGGLIVSGFARGFSASGFTANGTKANAVTNNDYYQVTLTVQAGYTLSLHDIDIRLRRSSTAAPNQYRWMYSLNGTSFINAGSSDDSLTTIAADGDNMTETMLADIAALQNLPSGTTVTLRLYLWGASNTTSTVAIGRQPSGNTSPSLSIGGRVKRTGDLSLIGFQFASPVSKGNEDTYPSTANAMGIYSTQLTRGSGIPGDTAIALSRGFTAVNYLPVSSTKSDALAANNYYEFKVAPMPGSITSLKTLDARIRRSAAGCNAYRWRYSLNGVSFTDIGSSDVSFTSTFDGIDQPQMDLSSISALQNLGYGQTVTFRLYAWGATTTTGTFAIGRHVAGEIVNSLEVQGSLSRSTPAQFNAGTYNLRFENTNDSNDLWVTRYPRIANLVKDHTMDIFGVQEISPSMFGDLMPMLPDYAYTGLTNNGDTTSGYYSAIVYNKTRFTLSTKGTFWLSATPDVVSYGWDAVNHLRICTWGKFTDNVTGFNFYFFNTHLDNEGALARKNGAALILCKMDTIAGSQPVIFTGDFNVDQLDSVYISVNNSGRLKNTYHLTHDQHDTYQGTFNSFDTSAAQGISRIDHVFLSSHFLSNVYDVFTDKYNGYHYPSDHFPVSTNVQARQNNKGELYWDFPEDFENGTPKTTYAAANCTLKTGVWRMDNVVLQNTANDAPSSGVFAARMNGDLSIPAYLQMMFDLPEGASKVVVWHSSYKASADAPCKWILEYSTNGGTTWQRTGDTVNAVSKAKQQVVFPVNITGNIRFRINKLGPGAINNGRLSIDDISVFRSDSDLRPTQVNHISSETKAGTLRLLYANQQEAGFVYTTNISAKGVLSIFDMTGRSVATQYVQVNAGANVYKVSTPLVPGIYVAAFQSGSSVQTVKFSVN